ncbi:MAG: lysophospholipid acyltransferase family protein [Candidatus Abyssubacteria bacterium]
MTLDTDIMPMTEKRTGAIRALLYVGLIFLYTLVLGIPCLALVLVRPRSNVAYWFIRTWASLLLWTCGVRLQVRGRENLPPDGPFILMSTHNSHFDIPVLVKEVPRQFRIVAKKSLFRIPVFGWIMRVAGYVPVDRGDRTQAFASLDRAAETVQGGMPLLVFPEGTRSPDGSLGPFKKGGFVLAAKSKAPIIPVVIDGTFHVLPKWSWRISPGCVSVTFGKKIETSTYSYETKESLMEAVRRSMLELRGDAGDSDR